MRIYIPFADRALGYNCPECGFRCCRGLGMSGTVGEQVWIAQQYPEILTFTGPPQRSAAQHLLRVINHPPGCYFLETNGHCQIQSVHGRAHKPLMCRTFPTNRSLRTKDCLIPDFGPFCPVRPYLPESGDTPLVHAEVLDDVRSGLEPLSLLARPIPSDVTGAERLTPRDIDREEWLRDTFRPGQGSFETLLRASGETSEASGIVEAVEQMLGLEATGSLSESARELILLLSPKIRLAAFLRAPQPLSKERLERVLPKFLVATGVYLDQVAKHIRFDVDVGTVTHILEENFALLWLLAQARDGARLTSLPLSLVIQPPLGLEDEWMRLLDQLARNENVLVEVVEQLPPHARARLLRRLADPDVPLELKS